MKENNINAICLKKALRVLIIVNIILLSIISYSQRSINPISYFEKYIISGEIPPDDDIYIDYQSTIREIRWNDQIIKDFNYSNETLDRNGYEYVKTYEGDKNQHSKVYRKCNDGVVIEIREWFDLKYSISIQWFLGDYRKNVGHLLFCDKQKKTQSEIGKEIYNSFKSTAVKEYMKKTISYDDRKSKPKILNGGEEFLKSYFYDIIQPNNRYKDKEFTIFLNPDGSKEVDIHGWTSARFNTSERQAVQKEYEFYSSFMSSGIEDLDFSNPPDTVFDEILIPKTNIYVKILNSTEYMGSITIKYDPNLNQNSVVVKKNKDNLIINDDDIIDFLSNSKKGTYKLKCYKVQIAISKVWGRYNLFYTSFIAFN